MAFGSILGQRMHLAVRNGRCLVGKVLVVCWLLPRLPGLWKNVRRVIPRLRFLKNNFFVEISSRAQ